MNQPLNGAGFYIDSSNSLVQFLFFVVSLHVLLVGLFALERDSGVGATALQVGRAVTVKL